ncbi:MAG: hypothetical protein ACJ73S_11750 [Mycobacteriales bacterium]
MRGPLRKRALRRTLLPACVVTVLAVTAACQAGKTHAAPSPARPTPSHPRASQPGQPVVTPLEAAQILSFHDTTMTAANLTLSLPRAATVQSGAALDDTAAKYAVGRAIGVSNYPRVGHDQPSFVIPPTAGSAAYFGAVSHLVDSDGRPVDTQVLTVFARDRPSAAFRMVLEVPLDRQPVFAVDAHGLVSPPAAGGGGLAVDPQQAASLLYTYVDTLGNTSLVAPDAALAQAVATERDAKSAYPAGQYQRSTQFRQQSYPVYTFPALDNGVIAVFSYRAVSDIQAIGTAPLSVEPNTDVAAMGGRAGGATGLRTLTTSMLNLTAVHVPPTGSMEVLGFASRLVTADFR